MITTQRELRAEFWREHPHFTHKPGKTQNDYPVDVRLTWCDWLDMLERTGHISESLAYRATL